MNIIVNFKKQAFSKSNANLILFADEKFNIAGLNFGIDFRDIGARLPGLGNIAARRSHDHTTIE